MRIGQFCTRLMALVAVGTLSNGLLAQSGGESTYRPPVFHAIGGPESGSGAVQAIFLNSIGGGPSTRYMDGYGNPLIMPASYCPACGDGCSQCVGGYPAACGCSQCCSSGQAGTYPPFVDPGQEYSLSQPFQTEQSGPHYFDVRMEAVFLTRDETFRQQIDFTSLNVAGPIVLSSNDLEIETEVGFRIMGRYDIGALSLIEFSYMGVESLDASASFTDPDPLPPPNTDTGNLYSLFSDFASDAGMVPGVPGDVIMPGGSLPATERSITHSLSLETELHVAEMNYRRYWVGFNPCVSGTLLCGFRFTRLREDFDFTTVGEAEGQYLMIAKNDLAGFQTGGDVWIRLMRGWRAGAEAKVGIFNNHYTLENSFSSTDPGQDGVFSEHFEKDIPAFIGEASIDVIADLTPSWSLRAGYEIHVLNSLVLTGENFNTGTIYNGVPGVLLPVRVPFLFNQGNALYHGGHIGAEYIW